MKPRKAISAVVALLIGLPVAVCTPDDRHALRVTTTPAAGRVMNEVTEQADVNRHLANSRMQHAGYLEHVAEVDRARIARDAADRAARSRRRAAASRTRAAPVVVAGGDVWARLRRCESGGNYAANTGNGYYGAYQASHSTWGGYAGYSNAHLAPPAVQDEWARALYALRGWQPWPACSRKLGLR